MWVKTTCCNSSLSFFKLETSDYNVLVQSFTSTQAATCRELQLSLIFQFLLEGSYNPLSSCTTKILVRRCWPTEGYNLLFLPGNTFHQFSDCIHEHQMIIKKFFINQTPFHQLDLKSSRYFSTSCTQTQYQKPHNRTQNTTAISRNSQITA